MSTEQDDKFDDEDDIIDDIVDGSVASDDNSASGNDPVVVLIK